MGTTAAIDDGDRGIGAPASRAMAELRCTIEQARARGELTFEELAACRDGFCLLGAPMAEVVALVLDFAEPEWVGSLLAPPREHEGLEHLTAEQRVEHALALLQRQRSTSGVHECLAQRVTKALSERPRPSLRSPALSTVHDSYSSPSNPASGSASEVPPSSRSVPGEMNAEPELAPRSSPNLLQLPRGRGRLDGW